ncbi:MAG TPA: metallophosphoesterase [Bryobacteraceae bacterium]|nr:metallophosphoesterase [Bryobacteraceae bacterium]
MNPNSTLAPFLVVAQCYIVLTLLTEAHRRFSGRKRIAAWAAVLGFESLMAVIYLGTFTNRYGIAGRGEVRSVLGIAVIMWLITSTSVAVVYLVVRPIRNHFRAPVDSSRRRALSLAGNALLCAPVAAISYGSLIQRTDFEVREIDLPVPGLPRDLDGIRLLQISDIHLSPFLSEKELARVIDATLGLHPHVTFVTGDLISTRRDPLDACIRQLARLKADAGVFGCMGNHEHYAGVEAATEAKAARVGIRFLRSQSTCLRFGNSRLNVAGVDYEPSYRRHRYLQGAERFLEPGAFNLLLSHNPDVFPFAARQGYDLVLAGHTHGGQVNIEIFGQSINPARFHTPYVYGLYRQDRSAEYVTRGVGTIGVPVRLGAPPEVALLRLRKT